MIAEVFTVGFGGGFCPILLYGSPSSTKRQTTVPHECDGIIGVKCESFLELSFSKASMEKKKLGQAIALRKSEIDIGKPTEWARKILMDAVEEILSKGKEQ